MWVKKLRLQKCWSQEQLAEFSGLSVRTIQRLEKGQPASMESLKALASVFELNLSDLQEDLAMINETADINIETNFKQKESPKSALWISREEKQAIQYMEILRCFYIHLIIFIAIMPSIKLNKDSD
ncbi:helix-turn-helix domain-containing protein [Aliikangiella maris]|uniref:Helix-turn-helix transcriptional regulator n=2 Tax=Aliikangiella maris TaxID=3162458 RepID=A0ABV3MLD2_9GAMM